MPITQSVCASFETELLCGIHDFSSDVFKIALYDNTATLDSTTTAYTATGEITDAGYTAGGEALTGVSINAAASAVRLDANDITWTGNFTIAGALIYNSSKANRAVAVYTLITSSQGGQLTVLLHGFLALTFQSGGNMVLCDSFLAELFRGIQQLWYINCALDGNCCNAIPPDRDVFAVALFTDAVTLDSTTTAYSATGEASGMNYAPGGSIFIGFGAMYSQTMQFISGDLVWDINRSGGFGTWSNPWFETAAVTGTLTARYALIYNVTKANRAVLVMDFCTNVIARGRTQFPIASMFPSDGLIRLEAASPAGPTTCAPLYAEAAAASHEDIQGTGGNCGCDPEFGFAPCPCEHPSCQGQTGCGHTLVYGGSVSGGGSKARVNYFYLPSAFQAGVSVVQIENQMTVTGTSLVDPGLLKFYSLYPGIPSGVAGEVNFGALDVYAATIWPNGIIAEPPVEDVVTTVGFFSTANAVGLSTIDVTDVRLTLIAQVPPNAPGALNGSIGVFRLPAPACTLIASVTTPVCVGSTVTLTWTSTDATSADLQPGIGPVALNGSLDVTPIQNTTYTLTVSGIGGSSICQVSVQITTDIPPCPPPPILPYSDMAVINELGAKPWAFAEVAVALSTASGESQLIGEPPSPLKAIYQDALRTPQANPWYADQQSDFTFWVETGQYILWIRFGDRTIYQYPITVGRGY